MNFVAPQPHRQPKARVRHASRLGLLLLTALTSACQTRPSVALEVPLASKYVFRGAVLNDHAVLQPSLYVTAEDEVQSLTVGGFGNLETTDETDHRGEFTEVDYSADYGRGVGPLYFSFGAARYHYPNTGFAESTEAYVIVALSDAPVIPALEYWYDFEELDGGYLNFNLSRGFELGEAWSLDLVTGVGFMGAAQADSYYGVAQDGLSDALVQVTVSRPLSAYATLAVIGAFSSLLDGDFRDAVDEPDNAWGAVGISFGF